MNKKYILIILSSFLIISCVNKDTLQVNSEKPLDLIAESDMLWTGVAFSKDGRIFVNFPRWSDTVPVSVGEIIDGEIVPYPNTEYNSWDFGQTGNEKFICVQSVYIDDENYLWILDPASPFLQGVIETGGKLYKIDLNTNSIVKTFKYDSTIIYPNSYLNDVRVDTEMNIAYITDSGVGSIIVTDLNTGKSWRCLDGHPSVNAYMDFLQFGMNKIPIQVHSDGIALNNDKTYLYYIALTSHTLYRIKTEYLIHNKAYDEHVEKVANLKVATDGMMFDNDDNLFLGGLENNSIYVFTKEDQLIQLISDDKIKWADSFAKDNEGNMYFTTSQLHLTHNIQDKFRIFKLNLK